MNWIPINEITIYFNPTSSEEVFQILKNMRKQGAQDDIPLKIDSYIIPRRHSNSSKNRKTL